MKVTLYQRKKNQYGNFSIERVFADVRKVLDRDIVTTVKQARFHSKGIIKRLINIIEAPFYQNDINHITGDIHYVSLLLKKKKTILTILDCVSLNRLAGLKKIILYIFWYWLPFKRVCIVTAISESTKRELISYLKCPYDKIKVIYCPVSDIFKPAIKPFNLQKPLILQIGITDNKNILRVSEALKDIPCHFRIIGKLSNIQIESLEKHNIEYSSIMNLSNEEIIEEYIKCDLLAFVSTYEGFGLPILEAQATGRPVITSNIYSMPEVAGDAACLVDPFNVENIRNGFLRMLNDAYYREDLIQKGLKNVERFRVSIIAQQYAELYRKVHLKKI